jgi:purine-binding chemotaxis protein CheW
MNDRKTKQKKLSAIDWAEVHRRIEAANRALETGFTPDGEKVTKTLRERAIALARGGKEEKQGDIIEIVEFVLAVERYGLETSYVEEVWPLKNFTPLPGTPGFVVGIMNVRGRIVSVIDLKRLFDIPEKGLGDLNKVIILKSEEMEFGILADAVVGVSNVYANELQPSLPTLTGIREEYLKGLTRERVVILDAKKLLSDKSIIVLEEVS